MSQTKMTVPLALRFIAQPFVEGPMTCDWYTAFRHWPVCFAFIVEMHQEEHKQNQNITWAGLSSIGII